MRRYLVAAAACLAFGATFGVVSAIPHGWPSTLGAIAFQKTRPLHVTFSIAWIFMAYLGALWRFVPEVVGRPWWSPRLAKAQFWLLAAAGAVAGGAYTLGIFSGREYLDFGPAVSILIAAAWTLYLVNFFATVRCCPRPWPVQLWMWSAGAVVFTLTFVEGHLHLLPAYGDNLIRDLTVQWKSYGGLIGSWNLVVYGLAIHLAHRFSGGRAGFSTTAYAFFWLALFNLVLGFAHHTYPVPQSLGLRWVSYLTSMTEWVILGHLLWTWSEGRAEGGGAPARDAARRFLRSATFWIAVNLTIALLISIPRLNAVTHGTHVTIAHAMGSTIGINTMILLAAGFAVLLERRPVPLRLAWPVRAANAGLALLFFGLLLAGGAKGRAMIHDGASFPAAMEAARPFLHLFVLGGVLLWVALLHFATLWVRLALAREAAPSIVRAEPLRPAPLAFVAGAVLLAGAVPWLGPAPAVRRGAFAREACWRCHDGATAPDLAREGWPASDGWVRVKLANPRWARGDSVMPHFRHLTPEEREELVAHLGRLRDARPWSEAEIAVPPRPKPDPALGDALYVRHCASCHGESGRGDGPAAALLDGECLPRDFTRAQFRSRSTETLPLDEDLFRTITRGMPGSAMPPHAHLPAQDRWHLVDRVKRFARIAVDGDGDGFNAFDRWPREPVAIPEPPAPSPDRVARGRMLLEKMECITCHGAEWRGLTRTERGFDWADEAGRPIPRSADLVRGLFKSGSSPKDLYRTIFLGRAGTPMPSYGSIFHSDEDRWAIVEYVRSLRETRVR